MDKRLITAFALLLLTLSIALVGCIGGDGGEDSDFGKIGLDANILYLAVGDVHNFALNSSDKGGKYKWTAKQTQIAEVDDKGVLTAKSSGQTSVTVSSENGKTATCDIVVGDSVVSAAYDTESLPPNRYKKVQDAVDIGGFIIVMRGDYDEFIKGEKPFTLFGVDSVSLRGIAGASVTAENISLVSEKPPKANEATVSATSTLSLKNCSFSVLTNAEEPKNNTGGYAVFVNSSVKQVKIYNCGFSNYRYAIYIDKAPADIDISENNLNKNRIGIGANLALGMSNAEASGAIKDNIYTECHKQNEFTFIGGDYQGALDFNDFYNMPPNNPSGDGKE